MKAIVIGATGLVGQSIVRTLLNDPEVLEVAIFVRRYQGLNHPKLKVQIVDFDALQSWQDKLSGDVLFSAMGTTLKTVGSKDAQWKIDYTYQFEVAKAAAAQNVPTYVLVSSTGADASSPFFYLKMKGKLDEAISKLGFESVTILRPGMLHGAREGARKDEMKITNLLKKLPAFLLPSTIRPVDGEQVAKVAVEAAKKTWKGVNILSARDVLEDN